MKIIVYLTATSLTSNGPHVDHPGASGVAYPYEWSAKHGKHILGGKEMDARELQRIAFDVFSVENTYRKAIPALVADETVPEAPATEAALPVTVDSLFESARTLPVVGMRQLGFKLVNATRGPRTKKPLAPPASGAQQKKGRRK